MTTLHLQLSLPLFQVDLEKVSHSLVILKDPAPPPSAPLLDQIYLFLTMNELSST